ncbi:uncharacterized protein LOC141707631 isoform X1 [Apium graveolens]|uniref:uncharacterized protein LOC141707631 isoform X1 n=1 Tax=Apium graveolens TaxID=4045 RepID=UPI003D7C0CB3
MKKHVKPPAKENYISRKAKSFLDHTKPNVRIGLNENQRGIEQDKSTQSQPPDRLGNGNLVEIAVKTLNMNQMKWLSIGRTRSLRDIYKDAKRRKISNSSEAYNDKCGLVHTFEEPGQNLHNANQELVPGDLSTSKVTNIDNICIDWIPTQSDFWSTSSHGTETWVFCGSALPSKDLCYLVKFARHCGATVARFWRPDITHVITATDASGSCRRTMKVLMGILYGRWIISMNWIKSCAEANKPIEEEPFEVTLDNHGARDGPKTGRHLAWDNASENLYSKRTLRN